MRKLTMISTLFLIALLLNSCSFGQENNNPFLGRRTKMLNEEDEGKIATARLELIIQAIKDKDKNAIKNMFSEQAQIEADDLDGKIDYLFKFVEGNIVSWDDIGGSVNETNDHGNKITKFRYRFNVYTDKEQYIFSILEYTKDTYNSENIGLYCLKVVNVKDEEPAFSNAGIYKPEE